MKHKENKLNNYKGYKIVRVTQDKEMMYLLNTQEGINVDCFESLKELKGYVNKIQD